MGDFYTGPSLYGRFVARFTPGASDECWLWQGTINAKGYGVFKWQNKRVYATHLALMFAGKPRPDGMMACHSCDVRRCVNPAHLRWGTNSDNVQDMVDRNRVYRWVGQRFGEENPNAKLRAQDAREIRASSLTHERLAGIYGVSASAIAKIKGNRTWRNA